MHNTENNTGSIKQRTSRTNHISLQAIKNILIIYFKIVKDFITDLLKVERYSELEIAFGAGVPIEIIRKIVSKNSSVLHPRFLWIELLLIRGCYLKFILTRKRRYLC